jgi:hypothetical protein
MKDTDSAMFKNVLNSIIGMSGVGYTQSGTTKTTTMIGNMYTDMITAINKSSDPWQAWYEFQLTTTKTKIMNLESGSEEWYNAQMELLQLQLEQQQHIKDKTTEVNDKWLEMLEAIDKEVKADKEEENVR